MQFLKKSEVKLINGGYLSNSSDAPVANKQFVEKQNQARFLDLLSQKVKGANFKPTEVANFSSIVAAVKGEINKEKVVKYVDAPKEPVRKLTDGLAAEALAWVGHQEDKTKAEKINSALQQFNVLAEFEEFGLFFTSGVVKLEKIYTIEDVKGFVTILEPHLDKI